jgi:hypothetical protein
MDYGEFFALAMVAEASLKIKVPSSSITPEPGRDAFAIHGRLGAQVALLQSPILPIAMKLYTRLKDFKTACLTKHIPVLRSFQGFSRVNFSLPQTSKNHPSRTIFSAFQHFSVSAFSPINSINHLT